MSFLAKAKYQQQSYSTAAFAPESATDWCTALLLSLHGHYGLMFSINPCSLPLCSLKCWAHSGALLMPPLKSSPTETATLWNRLPAQGRTGCAAGTRSSKANQRKQGPHKMLREESWWAVPATAFVSGKVWCAGFACRRADTSKKVTNVTYTLGLTAAETHQKGYLKTFPYLQWLCYVVYTQRFVQQHLLLHASRGKHQTAGIQILPFIIRVSINPIGGHSRKWLTPCCASRFPF